MWLSAREGFINSVYVTCIDSLGNCLLALVQYGACPLGIEVVLEPDNEACGASRTE